MAVQFSVDVRNGMLDSVETTIGTAAVLEIRSGTAPASASAANSGSVLVAYTLASDWAANAASGSKSFNNTPISGTASGSGTATYFRIYSSGGKCHWQGSVTATGGGGDLTIDNTSIASSQTVNVSSFVLSAGN